MIKIENLNIVGWEAAIRGMRNPMNSWEKSDSLFGRNLSIPYHMNNPTMVFDKFGNETYIGDNDLELMKKLAAAGIDHRKFMRMIVVYVDITAPLYWWKEFDTYKVGTVANSCSTMHKIADKKFEMSDFSTEHLVPASFKCLGFTVKTLNEFRDIYLAYDKIKEGEIPVSKETKSILEKISKKDIWWQIIQLLPSSYNQRRTIMFNYEVLANIYKARKNHKLDEWRELCEWIKILPHSGLITGCESITYYSNNKPVFCEENNENEND